MNVKATNKDIDILNQSLTVSIPESDEEAIRSLYLVSDRPIRRENTWTEVIHSGYSNSRSLRYKSQSAEQYQYEDVFDYVLAMLDDTEARDFVQSMYETWCERGFLSERNHAALMKFYNNLKRRYG